MEPDVASFLDDNPSWEERLTTDKLWPGIPDKILDRLGDLKAGVPKWIDNDSAWGAEKAFTKLLLSRGNAIGVRNGDIIVYPPTERNPPLSSHITDELFEKLGWQNSPVETAQRAREQLDRAEANQVPLIHNRLLGYAGWLATNPIYDSELRPLEALWHELSDPIPFPLEVISGKRTPDFIGDIPDEDGRLPLEAMWHEPSHLISFPLDVTSGQIIPVFNGDILDEDGRLPHQNRDPETEAKSKFVLDLSAFLKRWGILKLMDWEYPVPQGPLFGDRNILSFVRNNDLTGQVIYIPSWYEVTASRDNILDILKGNQREVQGDRFIPGDGWPVSNYARYAGMFLCLRVMRAVEMRSGALEDKSPEHELMLELITEWLNEELPEPRGGANRAKGEGGEEDVDKASRARRLLKFSKMRLSGKMPMELMPAAGGKNKRT